MKLENLKREVESLQEEVDALSAEYEKTLAVQKNNKAKVEEEDKQHDILKHENDLIAKLEGHDYFDVLINGIMVSGVQDYESVTGKQDNSRKRDHLAQQNSINYDQLIKKYSPAIRLENCYRFGGVSAFPVNVPPGESGEYLGIRFDTFDTCKKTFVLPHYIILKKNPKNNEYFVFKSTVPKFVSVDDLAAEYLNCDLKKFVFSIRKRLIEYQLRRSAFIKLAQSLPKSSLKSDLSFSKINICYSTHLEIVLLCGPTKIDSAIVLCSPISPSNRSTAVLKRKLELSLKGCRVDDDFCRTFLKIMKKSRVKTYYPTTK
ncbi:hypothetical protein HII12_002715 [Brettanomyces bruxellensis]|uniref:Uncharacterized protein n=1 Tax=Dekkera bruxellensis TaxID=5007 RepID=A0A8H6EUR9_DEKBR|nr:hypothetical protein HII12_002715 [Brettanomyces bruxellensis]